MTIEEALVAKLAANAGVIAAGGTDIAYPLVIPAEATLPAYAYQRISGPRLLAHDGPTGLASPRFQFTCVAESYAGAKGLANAIRACLDGATGVFGGVGGVTVYECAAVNELDGWGQAAGRYTVRLDVVIWHQET